MDALPRAHAQVSGQPTPKALLRVFPEWDEMVYTSGVAAQFSELSFTILLASSGTIHRAVQRPHAATTGFERKTALSVKRLQQFLRFQVK
jgi:hypothetical protein